MFEHFHIPELGMTSQMMILALPVLAMNYIFQGILHLVALKAIWVKSLM